MDRRAYIESAGRGLIDIHEDTHPSVAQYTDGGPLWLGSMVAAGGRGLKFLWGTETLSRTAAEVSLQVGFVGPFGLFSAGGGIIAYVPDSAYWKAVAEGQVFTEPLIYAEHGRRYTFPGQVPGM